MYMNSDMLCLLTHIKNGQKSKKSFILHPKKKKKNQFLKTSEVLLRSLSRESILKVFKYNFVFLFKYAISKPFILKIHEKEKEKSQCIELIEHNNYNNSDH